MTQIVVVDTQNAKDKVTSFEVLDQINIFRENEAIRSGKLFTKLGHNDLLKVIRDEFSEEICMGEISHTPYVHPQNGQTYPMFELSLEQAKQILVRESKFVRKAVIAYITSLEQALLSQQPKVPTTFREALLLAAEQQAIIEEQQKQLTEQAPKVAFTDAVLASQSSCLIGELAKIITQNGVEIGEKRLFKWMRSNGYLGSNGDRYNIPMQRYIEQGLFELKKGIRSGNNGVMHTTITTKVKPKGQLYFVNKFINK